MFMKFVIPIVYICWLIGSGYWYMCHIRWQCADDQGIENVVLDDSTSKSTENPMNTTTSTNNQENSEIGSANITSTANVETSSDTGANEITAKADQPGDMNEAPTENQFPISFTKNAAKPVLTNNWQSTIDNIIAQGGDDQMLQVTGLYDDSETYTGNYENLGIERAKQMIDVIGDKISAERLIAYGRKFPDSNINLNNPFEGLQFTWIKKDQKVERIGEKAIVYHQFNSVHRKVDPEVEDYLKQLVKDMKANPEWTLILDGYTDSSGPDWRNNDLSNRRALYIKNLLINRGIKSKRMKARGHGELDPIASNDTKIGRKKNRRTEITIRK